MNRQLPAGSAIAPIYRSELAHGLLQGVPDEIAAVARDTYQRRGPPAS